MSHIYLANYANNLRLRPVSENLKPLEQREIQTNCPGANNNNCYPVSICSSSSSIYGWLESGNVTIFTNGSSLSARTVRCVPDLRHKKTDVKTPAF
ncbi:MAG: hypothetical protein OSJ27_07200 [Candidatus Gastranaerophilales bacterium]|nr:hypothetical protein [Candidatus Gastranaerophilales bacterium]